MEEKIIKADFEYLRDQLLDLDNYLSSDNVEIESAKIMLDDIIQHVEAFIKEDI